MKSIKAVASDQRWPLARIHCTSLTFSYQILWILSPAVKSMVASRDCSKPHQSWFGACRKGASGGWIVHLSTLSFLRSFLFIQAGKWGHCGRPRRRYYRVSFSFSTCCFKVMAENNSIRWLHRARELWKGMWKRREAGVQGRSIAMWKKVQMLEWEQAVAEGKAPDLMRK